MGFRCSAEKRTIDYDKKNRNDLVDKISFFFPKEHDYKPVLRDVLLDCPEGLGAFHMARE